MQLDANSLIASLIVSSVGFVLFKYGRKMERTPHVVTGIVLMVFPYFVPQVLAMLGVAALLCLLLYLAVQRGY